MDPEGGGRYCHAGSVDCREIKVTMRILFFSFTNGSQSVDKPAISYTSFFIWIYYLAFVNYFSAFFNIFVKRFCMGKEGRGASVIRQHFDGPLKILPGFVKVFILNRKDTVF